MTSIEPTIELWGRAFFPSKAVALFGVRFSDQSAPGSLGSGGRYRGKPTPFGSSTISFPLGLETEERKFQWICREYGKIQGHLDALGIETAHIHLQVRHDEQCNFELGTGVLALLSKTGLPVTISTERV